MRLCRISSIFTDLTGGMREPECRFWRVMNPTQTETVDSRRCGAFFKKRRSEAILVETKAVELCSISLVYTNCTGGMRKPERSSMR